MGACGPSCPTRGLPNAFTMDCLKHDLCVLQFGADPKTKDLIILCVVIYLIMPSMTGAKSDIYFKILKSLICFTFSP